MRAYLRRLFDHAAWADDKVLAVLRAENAATDHPDAMRLVAHLLAAERVWLLRLRGEDSSRAEIWPDMPLREMEVLSQQNRSGYDQYLPDLSDDAFQQVVVYRNSAGKAFRTPAIDILTHVALHGSYHRGQVARVIRQGGGQPVNTDYIAYVRGLGT